MKQPAVLGLCALLWATCSLAQTTGAELTLDVFSVGPPTEDATCLVQGTVRLASGEVGGEDRRAASQVPGAPPPQTLVQPGQRLGLRIPCDAEGYAVMAQGGIAEVRVSGDGLVAPGGYRAMTQWGRPREAMAADLVRPGSGMVAMSDALCDEILRANSVGRLSGRSAYDDGLLEQVPVCEATAQDRAARSTGASSAKVGASPST